MATIRPIKYYDTYTDDFVQSSDQTHELPTDYQWPVPDQHPARQHIVTGMARLLGGLYCRLVLHVHFRNRAVLRGQRGFFLYANHTQPVGDPFIALCAGRPQQFAAVVSPANLVVPLLGRIMPWVGALALPSDLHGLARLNRAVRAYIRAGHYVTIFPEAHVWPYYTGIRPLPTAAFHYPVANHTPVFTMTTTYQRRRWGQRPRITVYIDGPVTVDDTLPRKTQQEQLAQRVQTLMKQRAQSSNYDYIQYQRRG